LQTHVSTLAMLGRKPHAGPVLDHGGRPFRRSLPCPRCVVLASSTEKVSESATPAGRGPPGSSSAGPSWSRVPSDVFAVHIVADGAQGGDGGISVQAGEAGGRAALATSTPMAVEVGAAAPHGSASSAIAFAGTRVTISGTNLSGAIKQAPSTCVSSPRPAQASSPAPTSSSASGTPEPRGIRDSRRERRCPTRSVLARRRAHR
jgi:hypothetical protein